MIYIMYIIAEIDMFLLFDHKNNEFMKKADIFSNKF